ncbi:hypothetical protein SNOG_05052 [Parastagonospora nodorum SN15]|uniref:Uncharacterized protein n=1 Tax=Phaeosphaeria nodorum (strain SN15 / ATCC MYA-4574 / FGSC 10173) TaxID=321614 RepID=Q0UT62_PHANO|nr:hypothetical protein SNOG_05052 [Parastagonospora nodorum SN15]EAT87443.1 hypothetical protein SNOG_05052 [Parastagonospora nodorum SN15]
MNFCGLSRLLRVKERYELDYLKIQKRRALRYSRMILLQIQTLSHTISLPRYWKSPYTPSTTLLRTMYERRYTANEISVVTFDVALGASEDTIR